jgi:hypothetical protein
MASSIVAMAGFMSPPSPSDSRLSAPVEAHYSPPELNPG